MLSTVPSRPPSQAWSNPRLERPPKVPGPPLYAVGTSEVECLSHDGPQAPVVSIKHPGSFVPGLICSEGPQQSTLVLSSGPHHDRQIRRPGRVTTSSYISVLVSFWASSFLEPTIPSLPSYKRRCPSCVPSPSRVPPLVSARTALPKDIARGRQSTTGDNTPSGQRPCTSTTIGALETGTSNDLAISDFRPFFPDRPNPPSLGQTCPLAPFDRALYQHITTYT